MFAGQIVKAGNPPLPHIRGEEDYPRWGGEKNARRSGRGALVDLVLGGHAVLLVGGPAGQHSVTCDLVMLDGILALVQANVIGIHVWGSRTQDIELMTPCLLYTSPSPRDRG